MEYGAILREIRIRKGLSQKEVYTGIISKSYAIEFEKGKHVMRVDLLIQILERISMEIDEFMYVSRGHQLSNHARYIYDYSRFANTHNIPALYELLENLPYDDTLMSAVSAAEIRCRIAVLKKMEKTGIYSPKDAPAEDKKIILDYLNTIESWTLQEVQLYGNTVEFLDDTNQVFLFKRLSKSLELYMEYDVGREIFCGMLVNLISVCFRQQAYTYVDVLITQLQLICTSYKELFYQITAQFFEGLLKGVEGDENGMKQAKRALAILKETNHTDLAEELASLIL